MLSLSQRKINNLYKIRYTFIVEADSIEQMKNWFDRELVEWLFQRSFNRYKSNIFTYPNYYCSLGSINPEVFKFIEEN